MTRALAEQKLPEPAIDVAILDAAAAHGMSLEPQRLRQLAGQTEYRRGLESRGVVSEMQFEDNVNCVRIRRPELVDKFNATAARVDFAPILDDDEGLVSGSAVASPEHTTEISLMGIRGMQNYVLLAEAGLIKKPDILYAETNPAMAITAERIGMFSDVVRQQGNVSDAAHNEMRNQKKIVISGRFEEVSARLFSPETQRLERLLDRRQAAARSVGNLSL